MISSLSFGFRMALRRGSLWPQHGSRSPARLPHTEQLKLCAAAAAQGTSEGIMISEGSLPELAGHTREQQAEQQAAYISAQWL